MAWIRRTIGWVAMLAAVMSVGSPQIASAQLALFSGVMETVGPLGAQTLPNVGPSPNWAVMQGGATGKPGFILPSGIWSSMVDYTFSFTGYPYIRAIKTRQVFEGDFTNNYFVPSAMVTLMKNEAVYPNQPATSIMGYARMNIGPNGFGGPMLFRRNTTYVQVISAAVGVSAGTFMGAFTYGDGAGGQSSFRNCCGFGTRTNTVTGGQNGSVWLWDPTYAWLTGTITVSAPAGVRSSMFTQTAMDNRTAAGTNGTIQLIAPRLTYAYLLAGQQPPQDGSASVGFLIWEAAGIGRATVNFTPEPGQLALIATGVVGLAGLGLRRRRG